MSKNLELTQSEADHLRRLLKKRAEYLESMRNLAKQGSKLASVTILDSVENGTVLAEFNAEPIRLKQLLVGAIDGVDLELARLGVKVTGRVPSPTD